jgi:hypothetical protein
MVVPPSVRRSHHIARNAGNHVSQSREPCHATCHRAPNSVVKAGQSQGDIGGMPMPDKAAVFGLSPVARQRPAPAATCIKAPRLLLAGNHTQRLLLPCLHHDSRRSR